MAVDLLLMANKMRGNLQNGSSGSRTRTSYQNQPGNLKRGTHIPGTNLKEDQGIRTVARKGRKGDSELRRVGGEVSHVNTTEANAIDMLGPMGEAWVQSVGSGTTNPKTGLKEYKFKWPKALTPPKTKGGWATLGGQVLGAGLSLATGGLGTGALALATNLGVAGIAGGAGGVVGRNVAKGTTWKPSEGKWGIFGQTGASKDRDKAKVDATTRRNLFEDFRRDNEDENFAAIFTENTEDDSPGLTSYTGEEGFNTVIEDQSGLYQEPNDIPDYTDTYDDWGGARKETELKEKLDRDLKAIDIHGEALNAKRQDVGTGLSSGLFGMLTQSQDTTAQKGFAGSGNFAADFAKKQAVKEAESQFGTADREQESLALEAEGVMADAVSGTADLHEDYNQQFWEDMMSWDTAINS
jgi:hypothetical protein